MSTRSPILLAVLVALFLSCARGPAADPIVGRWQKENSTAYSEYFADGTAVVNDGNATLSAKWTRLDDGRLKVEMVVLGIGTAMLLRTSFDGDTVTFTEEGGQTERYTRATEEPQSDRSAAAKLRQEPLPAAVTAFLARSPSLELAAYDSAKGTVTLRHKKTHEMVMVRVEDIEQGRFQAVK